MPFCILIVTDKFPTDEVIEKKMSPYSEYDFYGTEAEERGERPVFLWDGWVIGGRYGGEIKLKIDKSDETYDWRYYAREPRAGRLFRSNFLEKLLKKSSPVFGEEERAFLYMGSCDGFLYVDGAKIKDISNFNEILEDISYGIIGNDGEAFVNKTDDYPDKFRKIVSNADPNWYLTYVDIHW